VAACLSSYLIAKLFKEFGKLVPREVAGQFHTAITSSLTKWSLMILGACPSS
jgi:hypothetical protein